MDRINNDGHYEPGNLRLVTRQENLTNRRDSVASLEDIQWAETASPYHLITTRHLLSKGLTREQIMARARKAVTEKRKGWREIEAKLKSLTSSTPDPETGSQLMGAS
jgi:hypothetical protein